MTHKEKNNVLGLYGLLLLAVVLLCVPLTWPMIFGLLLLIAVQIAAPLMRAGHDRDQPYYQHLFYLSRTIWLWVFISMVTTALAGYIVYTQADNSIYDEIVNNIMNGQFYDEARLCQALMDYINLNFRIVMVAAALCFVPMAGFLLYRIGYAVRRALQGLPPAKPYSWI